MNKRLIGLTLILVATPLAAHDFWIQPQRFQVAVGAPYAATFQVGHGAARQRWGASERIVQLDAMFGGRRRNLRPQIRTDGPADLVTSFAAPGLHVIALQSNYAASELPAIRFNDYARLEGLSLVTAARTRAGTTGKPGRERYSRRAKMLVQVGAQSAANQALATRPIGLKLEIVPARNPYALGATQMLPVHVLYKGKRLAGATVKLTSLEADEKPVATAITDRAGRATFRVPPVGDWLVNVVWSEPVQGDAQVEFDTTFSSLTFGFGPRRGAR